MKKYILTVTLNPAVDKTITLLDPKKNRDHPAQKVSLSAGGKGINVSRALMRMRQFTLATGIVGGRAGDIIVRELYKENIPNDFLYIKDESRTNLTILDPRSHKAERAIEDGPFITEAILKAFRSKFKQLLAGACYVIFSGANANGLKNGVYGELIDMAQRNGVEAALDTRGQALIWAVKAKPSLLKPNLEELEYLVGCSLTSSAKIKDAVMCLYGKGIKKVIVTMGAGGALGYDGKEAVRVTVPRLKQVNDVGSGDTFLAGFISSEQRGDLFSNSLKKAAALATASTLVKKPGMFYKKDADRIIKKVRTQVI